ncbi:MAG: OstA-like protein [Mangrovibacterium sp.]
MNKTKKLTVISLIGTLLCASAFAQNKKRVNIDHTDKMQHNKQIVANANRLIGHVKITHEDIVMFCDSAYSYNDTNMVDAFGSVHIIKADTLHMYAHFVNYNGDTQWAIAERNVRLVNKQTTLTTDVLNYDMNANIGYYDDYGTLVDSTNVLHSRVGEYYANSDKAYFKKEVDGQTPDYRMLSDTLIYSPSTGITTIVGPTTCYNENDTLYASEGFYDTQNKYAELHNYPVVKTEKQLIKAKSIFLDQNTSDGIAIDNASIQDYDQKIIIKGNRIKYNDQKQVSLVTDSAHALLYSNIDTLYMHADTLHTFPDTIPNQKIVLGYYGVQFFREDLQGKCDSTAYFSADSTLRLYHEPLVWSQSNQLSADYMEMLINDSIHQEFHLEKNSFIISQEDSIKYNQIKGRDMIGYIINKQLKRINVDGNGQSIYYAYDSKGLIGLNKAMGSKIGINLEQSRVSKITFYTNPDGQLIPPFMIGDQDRILAGFKWQDLIRPKSIYDIFLTPEQKSDTTYRMQVEEKIKSYKELPIQYKIEDYPKPKRESFTKPILIEEKTEEVE